MKWRLPFQTDEDISRRAKEDEDLQFVFQDPSSPAQPQPQQQQHHHHHHQQQQKMPEMVFECSQLPFPPHQPQPPPPPMQQLIRMQLPMDPNAGNWQQEIELLCKDLLQRFVMISVPHADASAQKAQRFLSNFFKWETFLLWLQNELSWAVAVADLRNLPH